MADDITLNAGSGGATVAADLIGGVYYPRSKIITGADGTNDGDVSATNPLPIKGTGTAGTANVGVMTVQGIASMTPVLATLSGTNNITTVTTVSAVTAITNALPAGDNNIGNVDIVTVPVDPFGANADAASSTGSISAKLRFIAATGIPITGTVTVGSHNVTNVGTFAVQESGTFIQVDDAAFTPATSKVCMAGFEADESSTDSVDEGDGGAARMTLDRKQITTAQPHSKGGLLVYRSLDLDESEEEVSTSACCVYGGWVTNTTTATLWLKFYNLTAANTTVGSSTPVITVGIPGNSTDNITGIFGNGGLGVTFDTALSIAATTGLADNNTGAPGTNALIVNLFYKS